MIRYYKLKRFPGWYFKIVGAYAWCIHHPPGWAISGNPISVDVLIKGYALIELTKEQVFLELL